MKGYEDEKLAEELLRVFTEVILHYIFVFYFIYPAEIILGF